MDLLDVDDLTTDELTAVLDRAADIKADYEAGDADDLLDQQTLGMIFEKPSTRTRVSFETGMTQLGGHAVFLGPDDIHLGHGEPVKDTSRALSRYVDFIMARVFDHADVVELAEYADVPVINGLTDDAHPCQTLADLLTIREQFGSLDVDVAWVGDGNNVCQSFTVGAAMTDVDLTVATPEGYGISDAVYEEGVSAVRPWAEVGPTTLTERFGTMETEGRERLATEGYPADRRRFDRAVDLRYRGQSFDLRVPVPAGRLDATTLDTVAERFHERHERRYGHASPDEPVELVTVRLRSRGVVDPPALSMAEAGTANPTPRTTRPATFRGETGETPIYDRETLGPGAELAGPAVIEGVESTAVVPPAADAHVDELGNVVIEP